MSSQTYSSVSSPTERVATNFAIFFNFLPISHCLPPTTFYIPNFTDNKANAWLCRKWKDSNHLFTVMNKYWLGWINNCYLLACPRKCVGRPWKEERTKTLLNHFGKQDIRSFFKSSDNWRSPATTTFYKSYFVTRMISTHYKSQDTKTSLKNKNNFQKSLFTKTNELLMDSDLPLSGNE